MSVLELTGVSKRFGGLQALTLSVAGGAIGIALGMGASRVLAWKARWPILLSPAAVVPTGFVDDDSARQLGFPAAHDLLELGKRILEIHRSDIGGNAIRENAGVDHLLSSLTKNARMVLRFSEETAK